MFALNAVRDKKGNKKTRTTLKYTVRDLRIRLGETQPVDSDRTVGFYAHFWVGPGRLTWKVFTPETFRMTLSIVEMNIIRLE